MLEQALARYARIPQELRALPNWCVAATDKRPLVVEGGGIRNANVLDPRDWTTLDNAIYQMVLARQPAVGFILTNDAGFTCIDLDVCNEVTQKLKGKPVDPSLWTTAEELDRFKLIVDYFNTYTELSLSGQGVHLWLRGRVGAGARRDGVEVYSQERFIICTGEVFIDEPIKLNEDGLDMLVSEVRGPQYRAPGVLVEVEETETDDAVLDRAFNAGNADKFAALMRGQWQGEYPSQSEADLALMSIFTFYSKSNAQCRRLFRASGLGQREKAVKNDRYLNYTLETIRSRQDREAIIDAQGEAMARALVAKMQGGGTSADVAAAQVAVTLAEQAPIPAPSPASAIDWPPGVAGALARFVYSAAPRPVKEIAIITALAFLAGVTGKAFNVLHSGINLYLILVARSGVGKEAIHSGISLIVEALQSTGPGFDSFVDFTEYASGPALRKGCSARQSFINVCGEWGRRLQRLASDHSDGPMASLRTEMTHLYQKSGRGNMVGGLGYSNKENNLSAITGVAYSMIGETTPETFYQSITRSMMEDGFLSRFIIMGYDGERPALNLNKKVEIDKLLVQGLAGLCAQSMANNQKGVVNTVGFVQESWDMMDAFDKECDSRINGSTDEGVRQMWNRAHLKALRIAAVLAAADNYIEPVVQVVHAQWALDIVHNDIRMMNQRLKTGDIGEGDDYTRTQKAISIIREYFKAQGPIAKSYGVPDGMRESGLIPYRFLQMRCTQVHQFRGAKQGATRAITDTVRVLVDNGYLQELHKDKVLEDYAYTGRTFRVVSLPAE